jgi:hypothetical protein
MSGKGGEHGVVRVQVQSPDGNFSHPFQRGTTIGMIKQFAYDRLVRDKASVPISATSIQLGGTVLSDSETVGTLAAGGKNQGNQIDLAVALVWQSSGGAVGS